MTVLRNLVFWGQIVQILWEISSVLVLKDLGAKDAKRRWTCVLIILAKMVYVWIDFSAINVFVIQDGQVN